MYHECGCMWLVAKNPGSPRLIAANAGPGAAFPTYSPTSPESTASLPDRRRKSSLESEADVSPSRAVPYSTTRRCAFLDVLRSLRLTPGIRRPLAERREREAGDQDGAALRRNQTSPLLDLPYSTTSAVVETRDLGHCRLASVSTTPGASPTVHDGSPRTISARQNAVREDGWLRGSKKKPIGSLHETRGL